MVSRRGARGYSHPRDRHRPATRDRPRDTPAEIAKLRAQRVPLGRANGSAGGGGSARGPGRRARIYRWTGDTRWEISIASVRHVKPRIYTRGARTPVKQRRVLTRAPAALA